MSQASLCQFTFVSEPCPCLKLVIYLFVYIVHGILIGIFKDSLVFIIKDIYRYFLLFGYAKQVNLLVYAEAEADADASTV